MRSWIGRCWRLMRTSIRRGSGGRSGRRCGWRAGRGRRWRRSIRWRDGGRHVHRTSDEHAHAGRIRLLRRIEISRGRRGHGTRHKGGGIIGGSPIPRQRELRAGRPPHIRRACPRRPNPAPAANRDLSRPARALGTRAGGTRARRDVFGRVVGGELRRPVAGDNPLILPSPPRVHGGEGLLAVAQCRPLHTRSSAGSWYITPRRRPSCPRAIASGSSGLPTCTSTTSRPCSRSTRRRRRSRARIRCRTGRSCERGRIHGGGTSSTPWRSWGSRKCIRTMARCSARRSSTSSSAARRTPGTRTSSRRVRPMA